MSRVLIAGIGNIFLGDDGFGCEVAKRLASRTLPDGVQVVDFGIRGFDLAFALMDKPELAILVDAVPRGEAPGTLFVIEPELDDVAVSANGHGMDPVTVLRLVRGFGGEVGKILVVGCEPASLDEGMQLTAPVEAAVEEAIAMIGGYLEPNDKTVIKSSDGIVSDRGVHPRLP